MGRRKIINMASAHASKKSTPDIYADFETHMFGVDLAKKKSQTVLTVAQRQVGKSMMLGMGYGSTMTGRFPGGEPHPLQYRSGFKYLGRQKNLGGAHLYRTNNRVMSEVLSKGTPVPHTTIYYHQTPALTPLVRPRGSVEPEPMITTVAWCRRHTVCELTDALVTLQMMGVDNLAVVRSFEP